ncbi:hypothetical protein WA026_014811, partial [Henosepilachna vigintioctopunctata]
MCYTHSQFLTADDRSSTTEDDSVSSCRRHYQKLEEMLYNSLFRDLKEQLLKELNDSIRNDLVGISMNNTVSKIVQQNTEQETTQQKSYANAVKDKELDDKIIKYNKEHENNHLIKNGDFRRNKSHKNIPQETSTGMKSFKFETVTDNNEKEAWKLATRKGSVIKAELGRRLKPVQGRSVKTGGLKVATTKWEWLFVSGLTTDTTAEEIMGYIEENGVLNSVASKKTRDEDGSNQTIANETKNDKFIKITNTNLQFINNKIDMFQTFLREHDVTISCVTERWCGEQIIVHVNLQGFRLTRSVDHLVKVVVPLSSFGM